MRGGAFLRKPLPPKRSDTAENELRRAGTQAELEDAWFEFCDNFGDESEERKHLLSVYMGRVEAFKAAERAADYLRAG